MDAVVLYWPEVLLLVGPYGDWVKYPCDEPQLMVTEVDGLRLVGCSRHELVRRVPDAVAQVTSGNCPSPSMLAPARWVLSLLHGFVLYVE